MNRDLIAQLDSALRLGSQTTPAFLAKLRDALEAADKDAARLDLLEREAIDSPLTLHNLPLGKMPRSVRGLGLACTGRSIRQALDDLGVIERQTAAAKR